MWAIRIAIVVTTILLGVLFILNIISLLSGITVLNLLKVLAVPITLGTAVPLLAWLQKNHELDVENQRSQDEALEAYLDGMSQLLTDEKRPLDKARVGDSLSTAARARTLTLLSRLDGRRKRSVLQFLSEAQLLRTDRSRARTDSHRKYGRFGTVVLEQADLSDAQLFLMILDGAYLWWTNMQRADLRGTHLTDAELGYADLREADLRRADLRGAKLRIADLRGADLRDADLTDAQVTQKQLDAVESLTGATMPNGQKYEDWIKDREGRKEDE
jgi:uncharacterized protein YjbI with pentapeptide repeats